VGVIEEVEAVHDDGLLVEADEGDVFEGIMGGGDDGGVRGLDEGAGRGLRFEDGVLDAELPDEGVVKDRVNCAGARQEMGQFSDDCAPCYAPVILAGAEGLRLERRRDRGAAAEAVLRMALSITRTTAPLL
jgi:hypothetical protein